MDPDAGAPRRPNRDRPDSSRMHQSADNAGAIVHRFATLTVFRGRIRLYLTNDAERPLWRRAGDYDVPAGWPGGLVALAMTSLLEGGGPYHAIRVNFAANGELGAECAIGPNDDNDDLVFRVQWAAKPRRPESLRIANAALLRHPFTHLRQHSRRAWSSAAIGRSSIRGRAARNRCPLSLSACVERACRLNSPESPAIISRLPHRSAPTPASEEPSSCPHVCF